MDQEQKATFSLSTGDRSNVGDERVEKLDGLKSQFIQNVSHELRMPLQIVQGYADLLRNGDLGTLAPEQEQAVFLIADNAYELRSLVERVNTLLAIEAESYAPSALELGDIISEVVDDRSDDADKTGVDLTCQRDSEPLPTWGDSYHLQQAVDSLVENAIKFTPKGGQIELRTYKEPDWVCLDVIDSGIGIPEHELENIFSGFYQVDGSSTRRYRGIGLGLTVVRAVIEEHGGRVEVESEPGQGSRFTLKLPLASPDVKLDRPVQGDKSMQHILIVDDEEFVALTLREALESLPNSKTVTATNGEEALRLFEEQHFDLLITDYKMPGADGITLASRVREMYPRTVVIMVTAYGDAALREQAASVSIAHILDKPVRLADIRDVATKALEGAKSH